MSKFYFLALFFTTFVFSQKTISIKGKILEKNTQVPLESATVYLTSVKDSTVIDYTITDKNGLFKMETIKITKPVFLKVSYIGYQSFKQELESIAASQDFGIIRLDENANNLNEVIVKSEAPPIRIKKDTLEFNASSFKVRPDSNVESLLKQLPGVEIDVDGKITVNGKEVNQVLVNGKPFFDKDGKIALQSLPSDIINKVQVTDTKTRKEELTKQAASSNNASINLTIDEEKNKGLFGKFMGGYGSDKRYESSALINYFKNKRKVSVLASSNNINSTGFSMDEVFDNMGGGRNAGYFYNGDGTYGIGAMRFGGNKGITRSNMVGINYADEWVKNFDSNVSYFFTNANTNNVNNTSQINLLPTGNFTTTSVSNTNENRYGHNLNTVFEHKIDSTGVLEFTTKVQKSNSKYGSNSSQTSIDEDDVLLNEASSETFDENDRTNFGNSINFNKAFRRKGRNINIYVSNDNSNEKVNSLNQSTSIFYQSGAPTDIRNQKINNRNIKDVYDGEIQFMEPIIDSLQVSVGVYIKREASIQDRQSFDFNEITQSYSSFNSELSNFTKSTIKMICPKSGFSIQKKKLSLSMTGGTNIVQFENFSNYLGNDFQLNKEYFFPFAQANFSYELAKSKNMWVSYDYQVNMPGANQLLPVENIANPLNTFIGNPNIDLIKNHSIYLNFNNFDYATRTGYTIYGGGDYYDSQVVSSTNFDANGKRTTTYENVSGTIESWFGGHWNKTYKKEAHTYKMNFGVQNNYTKSKGFTNSEQFESNGFQFTPRVGFTYEYGELLTIAPTYSVSFNKTKYTNYIIESTSNVLHRFNLQTTTFWPKKWVFGNDFGYTYNSNIADGFKKDFYLWNTSLAYSFYNKKFTAKVKVYDLLDQNQSNSRTITPTTIRDEENIVLQRYVMFSLTYKIEKFAGKEKPSRGNRFMMY